MSNTTKRRGGTLCDRCDRCESDLVVENEIAEKLLRKLVRVAEAARAAIPSLARRDEDGWISVAFDPEATSLADELREAIRELDRIDT